MRTKSAMGGVYLVWAAVFVLGVTAARAGDISYTTNITSGIFDGGSAFTVGKTASGITVTVSGGAITNGTGTIGPDAEDASNTVIVTGSGVWSNSSTLTIGSAGAFSGLVVSNGGAVYVTGGANSMVMGNSSSSSNNWALVTGAGSVWSNGTGTIRIGNASDGNTLTVSNSGAFYTFGTSQLHICRTNNTVQVMDGGKFYVAGLLNIGLSGSSNATMLVSGAGSVAQAPGGANLGADSANSINSRLIVTNGGVFLNNLNLYVGGRGSSGAEALVTGSGSKIDGTGGLLFGFNSSYEGTNGYLTVSDGGLVNANLALTFNGLNNVLTNSGGILQFSKKDPTLTNLGTDGAVVMNSGTLSYCGVTNVNITNNWTSTDVGKFLWNGNNTLRLDNSTGTNALARSYSLTNGAALNYAGLELINGTTALRGKGVTIGDGIASHGGSLLVSNTTAMFQGIVTNNLGSIILAGPSTLTVSNGIVWMSDSAATTTTDNITFDAYTTNVLDSGVVNWVQLAGATQTVSGVIKDGASAGALTKGGAGVLILAASNLYTGATTVSNGALVVNGSLAGPLTLAGGSLSGTGRVAATTIKSGATVRLTVGANGTSDALLVNGNLTIEAGALLQVVNTNDLQSTYNYTVITNTGTLNGTFTLVGQLPPGWNVDYRNANAVRLVRGFPGMLIRIQ